MYHPVSKSFLYCAIMLQVEFINEFGKRQIATGTGFILSRNKAFLGVVTNRHVVDAKYSDSRKLQWRVDAVRFRAFRLDGTVGEYSFVDPKFHFPVLQDEDVALVSADSVTVGLDTGAGPFVDVDVSFLADDDYFNELNPGDFVTFSGFPEWKDRASGRPILRSGILSSDPSFDYTGPSQDPGARRVAIEAFSYSGSSGSPVFALACGLKLGAGLTGGSFREVRLIGVNAGSFLIRDGVSKQNAGIAYLFKSTVVLDLVKEVAESP